MDPVFVKKLTRRLRKTHPTASSLQIPELIDATEAISACDIDKRNKKRIVEHIRNRIRKFKSFVCPLEQITLSKCGEEFNLMKFAEKSPTSPMSRFLERDIRSKIRSPALEEIRSKFLDDIMLEVRKDFSEITHQAGICFKIKSREVTVSKYIIEPFRFLGKTDNYHKFLSTQRRLKKHWLLHCPLHRNILKECVSKLPYTLISLKDRSTELKTIEEFENELNDHINSVSRYLKDFYLGIINLLDEDQFQANCYDLSHYYGACTGLISVHLSRIIAHTMLHIVKYTESKDCSPNLTLSVIFEHGATMRPTENQIFEVYKSFLINLVEVGSQFFVLEKVKLKGYDGKRIHLCITDEFKAFCLHQMENNVKKCFEPIHDYLGEFNDMFQDIYEDVTLGKNKHFSDIIFEQGCDKIIHYKSFLSKIFYVPKNEYFQVGQLILSDYVETIVEGLKDLIDNIFQKLAAQHEYEVNDIHETFRLIAYRAQKNPKTTEELIEIGKYLAWVREEFLGELTSKVYTVLNDLPKLIALGTITQKHMYLNSRIINWLNVIPPILEQNFTYFDQLKFEAEENLQRVIEDVNDAIKDVYPLLEILNDMSDVAFVTSYLTFINLHMIKMKEIENKIQWINQEEVCLSFPKSTYREYEDLKNHIYPFYHLLRLCQNVQRSLLVWQDGQFDSLCYETTKEKLETYEASLNNIQKTYRNEMRQTQDDNSVIKFKGTVDDPDILNWPAPLKLCGRALIFIKDFKPSLTIIKIMCNPNLKRRHWIDMSHIAGFNMEPDAGTTLRKLMTIDYGNNLAIYEIISIGATKEANLLARLARMKTTWLDISFTLSFDNSGNKILTRFEEIQEVIDDHFIKVLNMRSSVFVKPHENEVSEFYHKLQIIHETIDLCMNVQQTWLHLLPVFLIESITSKISHITSVFREVNITYTTYIDRIEEFPNVIAFCEDGYFQQALLKCRTSLEEVHKGICYYIEGIRLEFPRFFFLSIEEIIVTLFEVNNTTVLEPYLNKIFTSVTQFSFEDMSIIGVKNGIGEKLIFETPLYQHEAKGRIEVFFKCLEQKISITVQSFIYQCLKDFDPNDLLSWIQTWPSQFNLIVSKIIWTADIHNAIRNLGLQEYLVQIKERFSNLMQMINSKELPVFMRINLKVLIVDIIHQNNVLLELIKKHIHDENDFSWLAQLKYYLDDERKCSVKILHTTLAYGNEFIDNSNKLIITPLTDRCHRTLLSAYHIHLFGSPIGPAGTGKTETVKDLAKLLGKLCVVFSCSDDIHHETVIRFIKGIIASGAWLAFDEFNRIKMDATSVISQVILTLQLEVKSQANKIIIDGTSLVLKPNCFICITMNPGYPGRSNLPENLKVLFRNVAMMVPDSFNISEVSLTSFGFSSANELSVKIVTAFKFMSERFSPEGHYDFGIRTLKAILKECDSFEANSKDDIEEYIVYQAIRKVVFPRLMKDDISIFEDVIENLFYSVYKSSSSRNPLKELITEYCAEKNINLVEENVIKMGETYDMLNVRQGIIIVGKPASGKSTTLKTLANVLNYKFEKDALIKRITHKIINPKSVTLEQLYGKYDFKKQCWYDGIVSKYFRLYSQQFDDIPKWLIFDGPIDTLWVENFNSVLDDNKKLCLSSGEMIPTNRLISFFFEVISLDRASPATVSRCGVIYMEENTDYWKWKIDSWTKSCNKGWFRNNADHIVSLVSWAMPALMSIVKDLLHQFVIVEHTLVEKSLFMFETHLDNALKAGMKKDEDMKSIRIWIQASFIQGCIMGFGSVLSSENMHKFDELFRILWKGQNSQYPYPKSIEKMEVGLPPDGLVIDFTFIYKLKGNWKLWSEIIKTEQIIESQIGQEIMVPTVDSCRYSALLDMHVKSHHPIMLIGPPGSGKTVTVRDFLISKLDGSLYAIDFLSLTSNTSSNNVQKLLMSKLNKKKLSHYGPPEGKTSVIFIDDLNMSKTDDFGAKPVLEILRQHLDHNVWYDLKTTLPIYLDDVTFVTAVTGINNLSICPRFSRHFSTFLIHEYSHEVIFKIYSSYLMYVWRKAGFPTDIHTAINQIVHSTVNFYDSLSRLFKPSYENFLYNFNLFDFGKVIKGCSILKKESSDSNKRIFPKLWTHEILRVFCDRVTSQNHKLLMIQVIIKIIQDIFQEDYTQLFENLVKTENDEPNLDYLLFAIHPNSDFRYEETNISQLREMYSTFITEYNSNHHVKIDAVLFDTAIMNISKVAHIISMPGGNAILLGLSGNGRKLSTFLASLATKSPLFEPVTPEENSQSQWMESIKNVLIESGAKGINSVFLIDDFRIDNKYLFTDLDYVVNTIDLQSIFTSEEQRKILEMTRIRAQGGNRNLDISASTVFLYFNKCCKQKLHVVLCLSLSNPELRKITQTYPSLTKHCDKIVMANWPQQALESIAESWLRNVNLSDDLRVKLVEGCKYIHQFNHRLSEKFEKFQGIKNYVTSISYLEWIRNFVKIIAMKQNDLIALKNRYNVGLDKLSFAALQISKMQLSLAEYQPQLQAMTEKAKEMTEQIALETIEVEKASALVKIDEKIANDQAIAANYLKIDCEADLAQAIPILEDAICALNTLKPTDITLVKSMKNPPDAIKLVMAAVCVIKDVKPDRIPDPSTGRKTIDYWGPSKRILGDMNFLQTLKDFDKDHIKPEIMVKIRKEYLPHKDFVPHVVAKASSAAEGLCKWIIAMDMYDKVAKEVAPKKEKLEKAEKEYAATMAILNEKKMEVARIEAKLATLNSMLEDAKRKQQVLQKEVDLCNKRLRRAQRLIGGLGGEKERWSIVSRRLQEHYENLAGDILISCAIVSYLGPFDCSYRIQSISDWHDYMKSSGIPCSEKFEFTQILGSEGIVQNWHLNHLPTDMFFIENAIIFSYTTRYSLFIDSHYLAKTWIETTEKLNEIHIVKSSASNFMAVIKKCMVLGYPVLLENVENCLNPALEEVLLKRTFKQEDSSCIIIKGEVEDFNENFRLYMTSYEKSIQFDPNVFTKVCLINFSLKSDTLREMLLNTVITIENPKFEKQQSAISLENIKNRENLKEIEEKILQTLSESKADILEDEYALKVLDDSKNISHDIRIKQDQVKQKERDIENFKKQYLHVANHGVVLFEVISELHKINIMYKYSLNWYLKLYLDSIQKAQKSKILSERCENFKSEVTQRLFEFVSVSLFVEDRLTFVFFLCIKLNVFHGKISSSQFNFMVSSSEGFKASDNKPSWIPDSIWYKIKRLSDEDESMIQLLGSVLGNPLIYENFITNFQLQTLDLPFDWFRELDTFKQLLVISCLRPDKITSLSENYIKQEMGNYYTQPVFFKLPRLYSSSHNLCPLIFLLTSNTDPMEDILKFAREKHVLHKFHTLSLGRDQGFNAKELIKMAQKDGHWVCLQNCHLASEWLVELETAFESLNFENTNEDFRLWLTTECCSNFPSTILQNSIKIVNEPLSGLKYNLKRIYEQDPISNEHFYNACPGRVRVFARLLYSISFFHVVIEGRKKFGAIGWNIPYEFKSIDFLIATKHLEIFLNQYENPLEALLYMIGECDYGGRVSDDWDQRLFNTILQDYLNEEIMTTNEHIILNLEYQYGFPVKYFYGDYLEHISKLPENDPTEIFGLHGNNIFLKDLIESKTFLSQLEILNNTSKRCINWKTEYIVPKANSILNSLPQIDLNLAVENVFQVVTLRERDRYILLLSNIKSSLEGVVKNFECDFELSCDFEDMVESLFSNKIPNCWLRISYPSVYNLSEYICDFKVRIENLYTLSQKFNIRNIWFPMLIFPNAFLASVEQYFSKQNDIELHKMSLKFTISNDDISTESGVGIYGLYMQGGRWNTQTNCICELSPNMIFCRMPKIFITPTKKVEATETNEYKIPVYRTSRRRGIISTSGHSTNYIFPMNLRTLEGSSHWIKRGTALVCQIEKL